MKNIQPLDQEALKKTMAESGGSAPTTPPPADINKIYRPPDVSTLRVPTAPTPTPTTPSQQNTALPNAIPATPKIKNRVAVREPNLKLFAGVVIAICILGLGLVIYSHIRLRMLYGAYPAFNGLILLSLVVGAIPALAAVYLLLARSVLIVRVLLILFGLSYAFRGITYGVSLANLVTVYSAVGMLAALGLAYWAWNVFKDVSLLEG